MKNKLFALILISMLTSVSTEAHDLFLRPAEFMLASPGSVTLSMWLAEAFPGKPQKWRADKTSVFSILGPAERKEMKDAAGQDPILKLDAPGTYVVGWTANPSYITIDAKDFDEYLRLEGYKTAADLRTKQGTQNKAGTEKYMRYLKTFLQVGEVRTDDYAKPFGYLIELVPQSNPYALKKGDVIDFLLLYQGKPLPDISVMATYDTYSKEHDVYAQTVVTDKNGKCQIKLDENGLWMVRANHMLPLEGDAKADWQSHWSNITFELR